MPYFKLSISVFKYNLKKGITKYVNYGYTKMLFINYLLLYIYLTFYCITVSIDLVKKKTN